jgi:hypothetical protein
MSRAYASCEAQAFTVDGHCVSSAYFCYGSALLPSIDLC